MSKAWCGLAKTKVVWLALMVSKIDMATYALSCRKWACLTFDIWWKSIQCLDIAIDPQEVGEPLHLKSTQYLIRSRNQYDDILWGKGGGDYDGNGKDCECSINSKMDCTTLKDIMHA